MRSVDGPRQCLCALLLALVSAACEDVPALDGGWQGTREVVDGRTIVHNPREGTWEAGAEWRIVEDLRLGTLDEESPELFGAITAVAVSNDGDLAVLDAQAREVRVFASDGRHLTTFGRAGEGPGEFQGPAAVHFDALDRLWVVDITASLYHLFNRDGEFLRAHRRPPGAGVILGHPGVGAEDGFFDPGVRFTDDRRVHRFLMRVDTTGAVVDTLPPVVEIHRSTDDLLPAGLGPFIPRIVSEVEPGGDTWLASTDRYTLYRRDAAGDTVMEIRVDVPAGRLTAEQEDTIQAVIDRFDSPVAPPVDRRAAGVSRQLIRSLHPDDEGRLFVRPASDSFAEQNRVFDVFDRDGRYLGRARSEVELQSRPPPLFRGGHVYGVAQDELGTPLVMRGRIVGWE